MAKKKPAKPTSVPVDSHKHVADRRPNIPTRETAPFAKENGAQPFVVHRDVRSGDTDDVACWFIDTDYDGQSFFVRHAYFLHGGKDSQEGPYDKLKKALRAEIDEGEWSKLYRAVSQPFDPPRSGKIAVKVINHFGDEVLKVYPVHAAARAR